MRGRNTIMKSALTALIMLVCLATSGMGSADTVKDWLSTHHEGVFHTADLVLVIWKMAASFMAVSSVFALTAVWPLISVTSC